MVKEYNDSGKTRTGKATSAEMGWSNADFKRAPIHTNGKAIGSIRFTQLSTPELAECAAECASAVTPAVNRLVPLLHKEERPVLEEKLTEAKQDLFALAALPPGTNMLGKHFPALKLADIITQMQDIFPEKSEGHALVSEITRQARKSGFLQEVVKLLNKPIYETIRSDTNGHSR